MQTSFIIVDFQFGFTGILLQDKSRNFGCMILARHQ